MSKYAYTTGTLGTALETKNYTYATGTWGDLLTNYNGKAISYDAIGNMTSYDGATFTWEGRSLASLSKGGSSYSYRYNADGIRTGKTVNGTVTEYFLSGSQILAQKTGNSVMWFFYDSQGTRTGLVYDGHFYYYLYNVQGDVVALADSANGQIVARYDYDAWGKCTVTNATGSTVGDDNPFRYRGYYYDTDTGLYYLNSRYYDPELRRFISSDTPAVATTSPGSANWDKNLFAYCDNNPVNRKDDGGKCWVLAGLVGGLISGGMSALTMAMSGEPIDWGIVAIDAAFGAISGVATFFGASAVVGGIIDAANSYCVQQYEVSQGKRNKINGTKILGNVAFGLICNDLADSASQHALQSLQNDAINATAQASKYGRKAAERSAVGRSSSYYAKRTATYAKKGKLYNNLYHLGDSVIHRLASTACFVI